MPKKITKKEAERIIAKYKKVHDIKIKSLEIVVKIHKKVGEMKLAKIEEKLEELTNGL